MNPPTADPSLRQTSADRDLLASFIQRRDEGAFGTLVDRYQSIVLAAAYRRTGNRELARDISQQVFVVLAKKAGNLVSHPHLGGWLYRTASYEAAKAMESEDRRQQREKRSSADAGESPAPDDGRWEELEDSLAQMSEAKRELIVMRYFQDLSHSEIGARLKLSEVATRKRLSRALAELGHRLERKGLSSSASSVLVGAVAVQASLPAPTALATQALAAAPTAVPIASLWQTAMTSSTAIKTSAAVGLLAAIPLGMQWQDTRAAGRELERLPAALPASVQTSPTADPNADMIRSTQLKRKIESARSRLALLATENEFEKKRAKKVRRAAEQVSTEVVVSIGSAEKIASAFARMFRLGLEGGLDTDLEGPEAAAQAEAMMVAMAELMPTIDAMLNLDQDPEVNAKFWSILMCETLELEDEDLQAKIEQAVIPIMRRMNADGLVFADRPEEAQGAWDERYDSGVLEYFDAPTAVLPAEAKENPLWSELTDFKISELFEEIGEMTGIANSPLRASRPDATDATDREPQTVE